MLTFYIIQLDLVTNHSSIIMSLELILQLTVDINVSIIVQHVNIHA